MKTFFLKPVLITLMVISAFMYSSATGTLTFELTSDKVSSATISETTNGHYNVHILLKEPSKKDLAELTVHNIGRELAIVSSNETLFVSIIKAKIDSGIIQVGSWASEKEAEEYVERLLAESETEAEDVRENQVNRDACTRTPAQEYLRNAIESLGNFKSTNDRIYLLRGLEMAQKALEIDPEYCLSYYWKAVILARLEEYQKAISALNEGMEKPCENVVNKMGSFYTLRGLLKHKTGSKETAFEDYNRALDYYMGRFSVAPSNLDAIMNIAQILSLMDKKTEALEFVKERIEQQPQEDALQQLWETIREFDTPEYLNTI